jgi:SMODS-associating 2TM, beta-strand rich effector domain
MIGLVSATSVIRWIAVIYAVTVFMAVGLLAYIHAEPISPWKATTVAISASFALQATLLLLIHIGWPLFWRIMPKLNEWLYPDIRGSWDMEITIATGNLAGTMIRTKAIIKQDLLRISMNVEAPSSRSVTLSAVPKKDSESGLPELHYVFEVTTKPKAGEHARIYRGAAILDIDPKGKLALSGNYWTTEGSSGHYKLFDRRHHR